MQLCNRYKNRLQSSSIYQLMVFLYFHSQKDYTKLHPKGLLPVKINDVLFSIHAVLMNSVLILQCYVYERGEQKLSSSMITLVGGLWSTMVVGLFMAISEKIKWIRYIYYLSYIKVGTTPIKYTPQVNQDDSAQYV